MRFNLSNKSSFKDFQNFVNQFQDQIDFVHDPSSAMSAYVMQPESGKPYITMSQGALNATTPKQAQGIFLHEVGHVSNQLGLEPAEIPKNINRSLFTHFSEFRSDIYAASMMGDIKGIKSGLKAIGGDREIYDSPTHPSYPRRMANLDNFQSVIEEVGRDKSIPEKLARLSKEDRRLVRKTIPFEIYSARHLNATLKERYDGVKSQ